MRAFLERHFYLVNLLCIGLIAGLAGMLFANLTGYRLAGLSTSTTRLRRHAATAARDRARTRDRPKAPRLHKRVADVLDRNIFCSSCRPPSASPPSKPNKEPPPKPLKVALVATVISPDDPQWTVATVRLTETDRIRLVSEGSIIRDARITHIEPNRVEYVQGDEVRYIVKSINNLPLTSPNRLLSVYTKLAHASHLTVTVVRSGRPVTFDYQIR